MLLVCGIILEIADQLQIVRVDAIEAPVSIPYVIDALTEAYQLHYILGHVPAHIDDELAEIDADRIAEAIDIHAVVGIDLRLGVKLDAIGSPVGIELDRFHS